MNNFILLNLLLNLIYVMCDSSVIKKRYEKDCNLDEKLVKEIANYKNVTKFIMDSIKEKYGKEMYQEYSKFIDTFGARPSGSKILERSIDYMVNLTIGKGLHDVFTEEVDVPHWVRGEESALITSPLIKKIAVLGLGTSISTPPDGISAEVVVISSFKELDKTDQSIVKGKIVLFDAPYISYGPSVTYRTQGATKAAEKGAVATLIRSITPFSLYTPHTGAQNYGANVTKIPTACITHEDADYMRRLQDRQVKIELTLKMFNTLDTKKSRNTIVDLKGKDMPEKLVIVSGHIDSWDVGQGAMDDGGGLFISWFAPVLLHHIGLVPKRTLRAILWTSEEPGLIGAAAYLERHLSELHNMNFVMESDEGTFNPLGLIVSGSNNAKCIIKEILKNFTPIDKFEASNSPGSDITLFVDKGVPGAALMNANERYFWYHHSEADTMDIQNMTDVINCAAFWTAVSYVIADLSVDIPRS